MSQAPSPPVVHSAILLVGPTVRWRTQHLKPNVGEEHGHRVLRVCGKGSKRVLVPLPRWGERWSGPPRAVSAGPILLNQRRVRMDRHCATDDCVVWGNQRSDHAGKRQARPRTRSGNRSVMAAPTSGWRGLCYFLLFGR
jgi:hypothetical protein